MPLYEPNVPTRYTAPLRDFLLRRPAALDWAMR